MVWFPYSAIRNVGLQFSFAFPFSLLIFSQIYFIIFLSPWSKNIFYYLFGSLYPLMILPHSCLKYVEKNHTLLKVVLYFGFIHWHKLVFCDTFYFLSNPKFIIFPLPLIWCSQGVFFKGHMKRCCSLWKCLGLCFCIVFSAVTGVCLKEQHGIYTVDLATSPTLSTAQIFCGLSSMKNRIKKEKYSTPDPLIFSDALQSNLLSISSAFIFAAEPS